MAWVDTSAPHLNIGDELPNFECETMKGPIGRCTVVMGGWLLVVGGLT